MNLLELSELLLDERKAEEYLLKVGILKTFTKCEKCGSNRITKISRGRHRCNSCKSEWSNKKGSVLHGASLPFPKFIGLIKVFELGLSSSESVHLLQVNRKTSDRIFHQFRLAISNLSESDLLNYNIIIQQDTPTFVIQINDGHVGIGVGDKTSIPNSEFKLLRTRAPNSNATYYFDYKRIKRLIHNDKLEKFPTEADHFFRYVREVLLKYRGTKLEFLYLYLKEIEFRYNNKGENLFDKIAAKIACF